MTLHEGTPGGADRHQGRGYFSQSTLTSALPRCIRRAGSVWAGCRNSEQLLNAQTRGRVAGQVCQVCVDPCDTC